MDAPQYPGYHSQYWYPQSHSTGHYSSNYPTGSDVQPPYSPQVIPGTYPSAVYSPVQSHYSAEAFHPSNPFYCADPQRASSGPFPNQGCPAEQSSRPPGQQHSQHHYSGPRGQGGSGYSSGPYPPYSESSPNPPYPTGQTLPPSSQAEAWTHTGAFGPSQQQWPPGQPSPQNHYVRPAQPPAWPGTGTGAPPPYQPKDQKLQSGPPVGAKARLAPPSTPPTSAEISSPPQMYSSSSSRREPSPSLARAQAGPQTPGLARVQEVMSRVLLLHEDVDEFVGKKTDKSYRCLEELLTKELLELDSVETGGQETVRQVRKEAVQRIQAILDQLERKAF